MIIYMFVQRKFQIKTMRNILSITAIFIIFTMISSCSKTPVDLIVQNATIYTVDESFTVVESIAVQGGKIIATGTNSEIASRYQAKEIADLTGKYVYPGFNDAHAHFYGYGMNLLQRANLAGTRSQEDIYAILQEYHAQFGGDWIQGRGWDQNNWPEKAFPDKKRLDELFPDVAVYLIRIDGHAAWCNSKALELAGINGPVDVQGGEVLLKNSQPTGILIDNAMDLVASKIPEPTPEMKAKALQAAQSNCFAAGLTSVTDCGLSKEVVLMMDSLHRNGTLKMRINAMLDPTEENFEHFVRKGRYQTDRLMVNTIKIYADGALGSRGALVLEPYSDDPGNTGLQMAPNLFYDGICDLAYENNFQVATHCIGDRANRMILNTYGKYLKGENDRRWRIEHAQIIHPDDFGLFARYSVVPSIQATHATSDMDWAISRVGEERIKGAYAYQQLLQQLGWLPNGTDFPVEEIYPLNTFFSSVFRTHHDGTPAGGFQMENALNHEQALRSMTIWAAKASFEENLKGSLEPGKWADFVVLDADLMNINPQQLLKTKIVSTWVAGEKVYWAP
jgi:predicted amidohydrolase YtcJ